MTRADAQLLYDYLVARYGDPSERATSSLLDHSETPEKAARRALGSTRRSEVRPGTVFSREWNSSDTPGHRTCRRLRVERQDLPQPVEGRVRHHWQSLEWTAVLWAARWGKPSARMVSAAMSPNYAAPRGSRRPHEVEPPLSPPRTHSGFLSGKCGVHLCPPFSCAHGSFMVHNNGVSPQSPGEVAA